MTNLPYRQAMLIKHTAWMNTRLLTRGPRPEDERYVPLAVRMLTLVGCLNYAMLDLESELTASGLFHHETKRRYTQAQTLVTQAHGICVVDASQDRRPGRPAVQRQDGRGVSDHQRLYPVGGSSKVLQHRAVAV